MAGWVMGGLWVWVVRLGESRHHGYTCRLYDCGVEKIKDLYEPLNLFSSCELLCNVANDGGAPRGLRRPDAQSEALSAPLNHSSWPSARSSGAERRVSVATQCSRIQMLPPPMLSDENRSGSSIDASAWRNRRNSFIWLYGNCSAIQRSIIA